MGGLEHPWREELPGILFLFPLAETLIALPPLQALNCLCQSLQAWFLPPAITSLLHTASVSHRSLSCQSIPGEFFHPLVMGDRRQQEAGKKPARHRNNNNDNVAFYAPNPFYCKHPAVQAISPAIHHTHKRALCSEKIWKNRKLRRKICVF